ncbi:hypothetical protein JCM14036_25960 [Desulfotomaculum defluvii]
MLAIGPPSRAAKIIILPGFVFSVLKKSPSFPLKAAIPIHQRALMVSFSALPNAPSMYVITNPDRAAVFTPYQSAQTPFAIPKVINAE